MLIKINMGYLRIRKESMHVEILEMLKKYLNDIWVTFEEDSNSIIIKGEPERLYKILYRISLHYDIELM